MASRVATQLSGVAKLLVTAALTLLIALAMSGVHTTAKASTPPSLLTAHQKHKLKNILINSMTSPVI